jgi:nonribosomal peptide synthetase protein VioO
MTDSVLSKLRRSAVRTPQAIAIVDGPLSRDYATLLDDVDKLAHGLRAGGVGNGDLVGLAVDRSYQGIVCLLAVLRAGAAYVPLDSAYPASRLDAMIGNCGIATLLGRSAVLDTFPAESVANRIDASAILTRPAIAAAGDHAAPPDPTDTAYVIHTSGSTGTPKGVVVQHGALAAAVSSLTDLFTMAPEDRVLSFASMSWDTCGEEIYPVLAAGGSLIIDPQAQDGSVMGLLAAVERSAATVVDLPTAFWIELVDFLKLTERALPTSLRLVVLP